MSRIFFLLLMFLSVSSCFACEESFFRKAVRGGLSTPSPLIEEPIETAPGLYTFASRSATDRYLHRLNMLVETEKRTGHLISYFPSFAYLCPDYMAYLSAKMEKSTLSQEEIWYLFEHMPVQTDASPAHHEGCHLMAQELKRHVPIATPLPLEGTTATETFLPEPVSFDPLQETYTFPDETQMYKHLKYMQAFDLFLKLRDFRDNTHPLFSDQNYPSLWREGLNLANKIMSYEDFAQHLSAARQQDAACAHLDEAALGMAEYLTPQLYGQFLFVHSFAFATKSR